MAGGGDNGRPGVGSKCRMSFFGARNGDTSGKTATANTIAGTDSPGLTRKIEIFSQVKGKTGSISERTLIYQRTPSDFTVEAVAGR
jgi:hypothetical protein